MPSPFPGMDPYLEEPSGWQNVHHSLIIAIRDQIQSELRPRYWVAVEERVCIQEVDESEEGDESTVRPDASVVRGRVDSNSIRGGTALLEKGIPVYLPAPDILRQPYLEIRRLDGPRPVVTVIEVLSPANKRYGKSREEYTTKRSQVLASRTSLVEIDLLRSGRRMPRLAEMLPPQDYGVLVAPGRTPGRGVLYPFTVRDLVPKVPLPLEGEETAVLDLTSALTHVYEGGAFDLILDYSRPPIPPLNPEDAAWAEQLVASVTQEHAL